MAKRERATRRAEVRAEEKRGRERERLFLLEAGGAPGHPIDVPSASVVEPRVMSLPCPACGGELRVLEHAAKTHGEARLRVVNARCTLCSRTRDIFLRLSPSVN